MKTSLRILAVLLLLVGLLVACGEYTPITSTPRPTETVEVTAAPADTPTPISPTETPVPSTPISPTDLPPTQPPSPVLVSVDVPNGDFEGGWYPGLGGNVPMSWTSFACDGCPAADGRQTGLHEIVQTTDPNRVRSGSAVKAFEFWRPGDFGIYTDVALPDGCTELTVQAWVMIWSANEWADVQYGKDTPDFNQEEWERWTGHGRIGINADGSFKFDDQPFTSDRATPDDLRAMTVRLGAGAYPSNPLSNQIQYSAPFGFQYLEDGSYTIYDHYTLITSTFPVTSSMARIVIRAFNIWGNVHNDLYVDDVRAVCLVYGGSPQLPPPTPTPVVTAGPALTSAPPAACTAYPCLREANQIYVVTASSVDIYADHNNTSATIGEYLSGAEPRVLCLARLSQTEVWGSTLSCSPRPARWFPLAGMRPLEGAEG